MLEAVLNKCKEATVFVESFERTDDFFKRTELAKQVSALITQALSNIDESMSNEDRVSALLHCQTILSRMQQIDDAQAAKISDIKKLFSIKV